MLKANMGCSPGYWGFDPVPKGLESEQAKAKGQQSKNVYVMPAGGFAAFLTPGQGKHGMRQRFISFSKLRSG